MAQLVARLTGGQEAVSSSLATRTRKLHDFKRNRGVFITFFATSNDPTCERSECVRNEKIFMVAAHSCVVPKMQLF